MKVTIDNLKDKEFFSFFLRLVNIILSNNEETQMSEMEIKCLSYFFLLPFEKFRYQMFSTLARNKVLKMAKEDDWDLSSNNMNNKLYTLTSKGYLYRDEDNIIHLNKALLKAIEQINKHKEINIEFLLKWKTELTTPQKEE